MASRQRSFKSLKTLPHLNELNDFMYNLEKVHDRQMVIVASAQIETALEFVLWSSLPNKGNSKDRENLFSDKGLFSTFSKKIEISYRIDAISSNMQFDLNLIREIRNLFAHSIQNISLLSDGLADKCKEFKILIDKENEISFLREKNQK